MDDIFQEEIAQGWLRIYMDDAIIATSNDEEEHAAKVNHFLTKLAQHDLFLKPEKCKFHQNEVEYLGVIIGGGKVKMDPIKVKGIMNWPTPTSVKDVRSFLGFCNFYRAFIPSFSHLARPLNDLTKKNQQWSWGKAEQEAFTALKIICTTYPVLRTPDWSRQFILETDASGYALGAVLMQEFEDGIHPIAFHSHSLLPADVPGSPRCGNTIPKTPRTLCKSVGGGKCCRWSRRPPIGTKLGTGARLGRIRVGFARISPRAARSVSGVVVRSVERSADRQVRFATRFGLGQVVWNLSFSYL